MKEYTVTLRLPDDAPADMVAEFENCLTRPYVLNFGGCATHRISVLAITAHLPSGDMAADGEFYLCAHHVSDGVSAGLKATAMERYLESTGGSDPRPMQH